MAENVLAMTLRMRNTAVRTAKDLEKQVDKTGRAAQKMGTKFGRAVKASRTSTQGLMGSMVSLKTIIVATFAYRAIQKFSRFLRSLTDYYKKQTTVTRMLNENLASFGNYSKEVSAALSEQANRLQDLTGMANEEIETNMALLASYGMTGRQIKEITTLTIDFAKAKQVDLKTAFDLVGKASVGYTGTLSRYGIILDKTMTKEQKYAEFLKILSSYKGTAIELAKEYEGQINILRESWDDTKKSMGAVIATGVQQSEMLEMLSKGVNRVRVWMEKWKPVLSDIASKKLRAVGKALMWLVNLMRNDTFLAWGITISKSVKVGWTAFKVFFNLISLSITATVKGLVWFGKKVKSLWVLVSKGKDAYKEYVEGIKEYERDFSNWYEKRQKKFQDSVVSGWKAVRDATKDVASAWELAGRKQLAEGIAAKYAEQNERLRRQKDLIEDITKNREGYNAEVDKSIKLTKSMAEQFALATRLEQAQIKYMLGRVAVISKEEMAGLSDLEKKLISRFTVLKEAARGAFGEFTEKALGIEAEPSEKRAILRDVVNEIGLGREVEEGETAGVKVEISLTGEAEKLFRTSKTETVILSNRNVERVAG